MKNISTVDFYTAVDNSEENGICGVLIGLDTIQRRLYDAELMIERASGENELEELKEREHELLDMLHEAEDRRYARLKRVEQILDEIE